MEETTVTIVGAGPAGLSLAILLGQLDVKTIILEKNISVEPIPRGIALTKDSVRIAQVLGLGPVLCTDVGRPLDLVNFHHGNMTTKPFMKFDLCADRISQAVPVSISHFQPEFERQLRKQLALLSTCKIYEGCEVISRTEYSDDQVIEYLSAAGNRECIRTRFLIGADGKRGIVRKHFLETEGVKQQVGLYEYVGTWIAANLEISLPTKDSHPEFPLWKLGYTPEEVFEAFFPTGFHFLNQPHRPAVSASFGPQNSKMWRHEFAIDEHERGGDARSMFEENFRPNMTLSKSRFRTGVEQRTVEFPQDCINVLSCSPFRFAALVANKWVIRRTMIIGDAAHVFPPFGGEGIAAGLRDAIALGWRLDLIGKLGLETDVIEKLLNGWNLERRQGIDEATRNTMINGRMVNMRSPVLAFLRNSVIKLLWAVPGVAEYLTQKAMCDEFYYKPCQDGFFLASQHGGHKLSQTWLRQRSGPCQLSDYVLFMGKQSFILLFIADDEKDSDEDIGAQLKEAELILHDANINSTIISSRQAVILARRCFEEIDLSVGVQKDSSAFSHSIYFSCIPSMEATGMDPSAAPLMRRYNKRSMENDLGRNARFVILRRDLYLFSVSRDINEFQEAIGHFQTLLS